MNNKQKHTLETDNLLAGIGLSRKDIDNINLEQVIYNADITRSNYYNLKPKSYKPIHLNTFYKFKNEAIRQTNEKKVINIILKKYPNLKNERYLYINNPQKLRTGQYIVCIDENISNLKDELQITKINYKKYNTELVHSILTYSSSLDRHILINPKKYYIFKIKDFLDIV